MTDPREPVEVARFLDVRQAELALTVLEGSGIDAFIDQPYTGSIAPHYMFNRAGVRLFVPAESKDRALEVLSSFDTEGAGPDEGGPE